MSYARFGEVEDGGPHGCLFLKGFTRGVVCDCRLLRGKIDGVERRCGVVAECEFIALFSCVWV